MRTKDFIYYASAAVLMAVTTQVASADEVATQMPTVTEGNQYQPATAADIFGGGAVLAQESPSATPSSTVAVAATATSEVTNSNTPQVSQASSTTVVVSESRGVASESVVQPNTVASSENARVSTASEVSSEVVAGPAKLTHASDSSNDTDVLKPKASFSIENNNKVTGTFDAVIRNIVAPLGVKEVFVPSWSLANGQDDLIWHKAAKQMDGSYRVTIKAVDHKGEAGNYRADAYVVDRTNKRHYISEKVVCVNYSRPSATLTIENNNAAAGTFDAVVKNIVAPTGLKEVLVPSWSLAGGQDDLIWHKATRQADGSYRVTIKATDHKNSTGKYRADAYLVDDSNKRFYLTEKVVEVSQTRPSASLFIENNNADLGTFDAVIRNIVAPNGVKEVLVPSWSLVNGQDDLVWHKASRQSDGSYRVTIKASEHKNSLGNYRADVYIVDNANQRHYVTETIVDVKHNKPVGTISVVNNNNDTGTFDVLITNLTNSSGISGVVIPVWSEQNGQDDLVWHNATKQEDGSYKVTISASQHKWNSGKYIVHGYIVDSSGKNIGFGATSSDVVAPKKIGSASRGNYDVLNKVVYLDAGHGGYDPGASYFGISEKSLTLAIQSRVKAKLESEGYQVVTTRTSDTYVDLTNRSRAANASESDIFVSIHINASGSSAAQGIETYYYQPYAEYPSRINATYHANPTRLSMSDTLANAIQSSLINATGAQNQGVKRQTFAVLRETTAPAVLLELGFLSNPQEAARLNTSAYQETLANAIVAGIKSYYEKESKV